MYIHYAYWDSDSKIHTQIFIFIIKCRSVYTGSTITCLYIHKYGDRHEVRALKGPAADSSPADSLVPPWHNHHPHLADKHQVARQDS